MPWTLPAAGLLIDTLSGAVAVLVGFTGLLGGAAHYGTVLANRSEHEIEKATGIGFFLGASLGALALMLDALT